MILKIIALFVATIITILITWFFNLSPYLAIIILSIITLISQMIVHFHNRGTQEIEYNDLLEKMRTTSKDAHLKNKQLMTIASSIPFPILLIDQSGIVVMHNNIDEIIVEEVSDNLTYDNNGLESEVKDFLKDSFILEKSLDRIITINKVEYQAISVPVMAKGKYSGCLALFQNIAKTLEGEKMQKRFIADASHELKTPIAVIKGMVEILNRDDFDDNETLHEFLGQIEIEINRLDALVKDLLQLSRLSISNVLLQRQYEDVCELIDDCVHSIKKAKTSLPIRCVYNSKRRIFCDRKKMEQVMMNLLINAQKYSNQGEILITTYEEAKYYVIAIKDQGIGIKEEDQKQIFDRFYRVDDDRCRKSGGSGLGLAIVKSIVEAHDGIIEVESEYGKGSTFYVKLRI